MMSTTPATAATTSMSARVQLTFAVMLACSYALCVPHQRLDAQTPPLPPKMPQPTRAPMPAPLPRVAPTPRPAMPPEYPGADSYFHFKPQLDGLADLARSFDAREVQELTRATLATTMQSLDLARLENLARFDAEGMRAQAMIAGDLARFDAEGMKAQVMAASDLVGRLGMYTTQSDNAMRRVPPTSWAPQDPADSLYREARKALSSDSYRKAADLFRRIRDQYPKSTYTPDAPYWEAFALQRIGNNNDLRAAQEALAYQERQFPKATTRGDASALSSRIEGMLARGGDAKAAQTLYGKASSASDDGCPRQSDDDRVDALNALMQVDAERAIPILKKVLARREPCTQNMRRTAVWLIASRKAPDAADVLINVAKTDPDKEVREQAVFWLANVPTDEAAGMLIDLAKGGGDLELRKRAVYALSRSRSAKATAALREIALDANAPVELRGDALNWYAGTYLNASRRKDPNLPVSTEDPMIFLKDVYAKADDQRFRERVLYTIAQVKTDASRDFLFQIAQNQKESLETRRTVVGMFMSMNVTGEQIATLYEKNNELEMKRQLLSALGSLSSRNRNSNGGASSDGIDQLLSIARVEKHLELRKQAISQLSRSKDPRALALLQEIIDR